MMRFLIIIGTRPEIIKIAPLIRNLKACKNIESRLCFTGAT
jgi:UDP-N-acetylglucosamine 2-epimerase